MAKRARPGRKFERRVAQAFRDMGAWKVEHDVEMAGNQIDVYVELAAARRLLHRIAVEAKDWRKPVGVRVVNDFAAIVKLLRDGGEIDEGIVASPVGFTRPARKAADAHGLQLLEADDLDAMVAEAKEAGRTRPTAPPIPPPPRPHFAHPYPLQANFTGRVRERRMLTQWLTGDNHPVLAMTAIGGMGKSALTWVWVNRDVLGLDLPGLTAGSKDVTDTCGVPQDRRPDGVLWWSFYETEASFEAFVSEAVTYVSGGEMDPGEIPSTYDKVNTLVRLLQDRRVLLVLDGFERQLRAYAGLGAAYQGDTVAENARGDQLACIDPHAKRLLEYVASTALQARVLLTSRLMPRELSGLAGCRHEQLTSLDPDDAVAFFYARRVTKATRAEIKAACKPLGYHPLALSLLSGLVAHDKRQPGDIRVAPRSSIVGRLLGKKGHHILQVAYDALDPRKQTLLSRIAAFRSPMTYASLALFNTYERQETFYAALDELIGRGMLLLDHEQARYDLHPIVRQYAYDRLADKAGTHTRLREYFAAMPTPEVAQVGRLEDLTPTVDLYHHTVHAGGYDEAFLLFRDRLHDALFYRFGEYERCIELLQGLFPDGEDRAPRLKDEADQAWTLGALPNSYALSGQPRPAVKLHDAANEIHRRRRNGRAVATVLANLAEVQLTLGHLKAAEGDLRTQIELCGEIGAEPQRSLGRRGLGCVLAYRGAFGEAEEHLSEAEGFLEKCSGTNLVPVVRASRALHGLLMGDPAGARRFAQRARESADDFARREYPYERHFVEAEWLLGWSAVALPTQYDAQGDALLVGAEGHLTEALTRCRRINLVELEPDILLAWGRWHHAKGDAEQARGAAVEALGIADRCEYRLKQAEIHNFLAMLAHEGGEREAAADHARTAYERAWCDGPPYCYKPALDEAKRLLDELGVRPPDVSG